MSLFDDLKALMAVQAIDSKIDHAKAAIAALDTGVSTVTQYNATKSQAETLRAAATHAQAEQKDAELHLQSIETKTAQVNKTLYGGTVSAARELEHLQQELEMLARQKGTAEDSTLVAMEAANDAVAAAEAAEKKMAVLAARYRKIRAVYKEKHDEHTAEITEYETERAEAIKPVPPPLLGKYDAIRAKKSGVGAAVLASDGTCGGCHTRISSALADEARSGKAVQLCEHCARILVPESALV